MAEIITLTVPIVPPSLTNYRVNSLAFDWDAASITVGLKGPNGESRFHSYNGATATTLMNAVNKANHSTTSIQRQVINRLVSDGILSGSVSGSPD
jgi:hypothetical protein